MKKQCFAWIWSLPKVILLYNAFVFFLRLCSNLKEALTLLLTILIQNISTSLTVPFKLCPLNIPINDTKFSPDITSKVVQHSLKCTVEKSFLMYFFAESTFIFVMWFLLIIFQSMFFICAIFSFCLHMQQLFKYYLTSESTCFYPFTFFSYNVLWHS